MNDLQDIHEKVASGANQEIGIRRLFAAIVLATLDDAIKDEQKIGNGIASLRRWVRSKDGQHILRCAGIEPNDRTLAGMVKFVEAGLPTSKALTRETRDQQAA